MRNSVSQTMSLFVETEFRPTIKTAFKILKVHMQGYSKQRKRNKHLDWILKK